MPRVEVSMIASMGDMKKIRVHLSRRREASAHQSRIAGAYERAASGLLLPRKHCRRRLPRNSSQRHHASRHVRRRRGSAMCHFITATLPRAAAHVDLDVIARKYARKLQPLANASIQAQIGPDECYFLTTTGQCDCGTPLGALRPRDRSTPDQNVRQRRLRKKGWSDAKIARALAQQQEVTRASAASAASIHRVDVSSWLNFIADVLRSGKTSHIGLLLHMYSGSVTDPLELAGRETVLAGDVTVELLGHMKEDVMYTFRP